MWIIWLIVIASGFYAAMGLKALIFDGSVMCDPPAVSGGIFMVSLALGMGWM
ncbi:hypothetical protein [Qipengyuania pacifica]|uniref:hypothetical protein n=1 Tax=Qipengyuania pacifica TaxID=2860199 RepID=UPI001C9DCCA7|nr:hypothetical protein [Qipengyuania pacifica]MBY8333127.1 hypothetical protein [Qipengyuania pacifica]